MIAKYIGLLFRLCGVHCFVFGVMATAIAVTAFRRDDRWAWWKLLAGNTIALVSAMTYDWTVRAIGPFELTEYLGVVDVYGALAITAPIRSSALLGRTSAVVSASDSAKSASDGIAGEPPANCFSHGRA